MSLDFPRNVLIAPMDWGLGHATRCIPIIKALENKGVSVLIAASGIQRILLQTEFPKVEFLEIPGYRIRFAGGKRNLIWGLIFRTPALLRTIRKEKSWLENVCKERNIAAILSDNRYGLCHKDIFSVFITHQLYIQSGLGSWVNRMLLKLNYRYINRFSECWVPDFQNADSLAGILSHPPRLPGIPVQYCGTLSRFSRQTGKAISMPLLILISGPEPQRTAFENILLRELEHYTGKAVVVRGLPGVEEKISLSSRLIDVFNHLPSGPLNDLLSISEYIICRSGYSSLMDLERLQKKAILIPTPGQPEQEYLGAYLHERKWAYTVRQEDFNLDSCMKAARERAFGFPGVTDTASAGKVVEALLENPLLGALR